MTGTDRDRARAAAREQSLHAEVLRAGAAWTGQRRSRLPAYLLAGLVYAFTALLVALAAWALVALPSRVLGVLVAAFLGWVLWESRPRRLRLPDEGVLAGDEAPLLRALLAEVGAGLGTAPPRTIVLDEQLNAGVVDGGRRLGRVLVLGVPLWLSLPAQARVALLGHELGHFSSGDTRRTIWVHGALRILDAWTVLLRGRSGEVLDEVWASSSLVAGSEVGFVHVLSRGVMWVFGAIPYLLGRLLLQVTYADSRGAEYGADVAAARLAGPAAAHEMLTRLRRIAGLEIALQRAARDPSSDMLAAAGGYRPAPSAPLPDDRAPSLTDTHPATDLRLSVIASLPGVSALVVLDDGRRRAIDAELEPRMRQLERRIRDDYR